VGWYQSLLVLVFNNRQEHFLHIDLDFLSVILFLISQWLSTSVKAMFFPGKRQITELAITEDLRPKKKGPDRQADPAGLLQHASVVESV